MYNTLIVFFLFVGTLMIMFQIIKTKYDTSEKVIEYRYIPRTFEEEQDSPVYPSELFETMFSQPSPWVLSIRDYDRKKQEKINQYFISQL